MNSLKKERITSWERVFRPEKRKGFFASAFEGWLLKGGSRGGGALGRGKKNQERGGERRGRRGSVRNEKRKKK